MQAPQSYGGVVVRADISTICQRGLWALCVFLWTVSRYSSSNVRASGFDLCIIVRLHAWDLCFGSRLFREIIYQDLVSGS